MPARFSKFAFNRCRWLLVPVLAISVVTLVGCANDLPVPVQPMAPDTTNTLIAPVPLLENMTVYRWSAPFDRLEVDIERAMNKQEWALLNQEKQEHAIRAKGVVPDNRHAWVIAWKVDESDVAIAVRVGFYGDEQLESLYAARLQQVIAGKPKPKRNWSFELPPLLPKKDTN